MRLFKLTHEPIPIKNKCVFVGTGSFEEEYDGWLFAIVYLKFLGVTVKIWRYYSRPYYLTVSAPLPISSTNEEHIMKCSSYLKTVKRFHPFEKY